MAHVTVPAENSYVRYTSQTGTGPFAFTFTVFDEADLEVRVNGTALAGSGWTVAWDTSDEGGYTGGSITLVSSVTSATVDIVSIVPAVRGTDFSSGAISPTSLNTEFDKLTAITRDLQRDMARSVRFDLADTTADLGKLSDNASKVVAVNSSGTALEFATNSGTGGGSGTGNVSNSGTPANNQLAVWTNSTTIEGDSGLTWDGSTLAVTGSITDDGVAVPTISSTDTLTNKTLTSPVLTTPQINDLSSNQQYIFAASELTADRTVTLPLLTGNDTFTFNAHAATLTNKTIALGSNTVSGTTAQFNTALTDGSFATLAGTETLTNKTIDLTDNTVTGTLAELNTAVSDDTLAAFGSTNTFTGANDFSGGSVKVPASATPTISAQGDFALDTSIANYAPGGLRYHDGTNDMTAVAVATSVLTGGPTDGHVLTYDATSDIWYAAAAPGAGGGVSGTGTNNAVAVWSGTGAIDYTAGFTFDGTSLTLPATMFMSEVAAAAADVAGGGQIWVKNATPNELWFTNDAGSDIQITTGSTINALTASGTATLTNKTFDLGGTGNSLTGSKAEFNTALQTDTFVMGSDLGTNVATFLATPSSANLAAAVTDESGTGALVFGTSPAITTPTLVLQDANGAAPTTDGQIKYDRTGENLEVGDGTGTKSFPHVDGTATFTNKTINSDSNSLTVDLSEATVTGTTAEFNTALSDGSFATLAGTETLTNKTVNLSSNTLTGTTAQFNTALSDGSFATLAGTETLTNKTVTTPTLTLKQSATPTPTAEGDIQWDTDNNTIVVGNGTGQTTFSATGITGTGANDRLAVWSGTGTQDSDSNLTWDGTTLTVSGTISGADLATGVTIDSNTILRGTSFGSTRLVISGTNGAVSTDANLTYTGGGGGGLVSGILHSYTNVVDYPVQAKHETSGGGNPTAGFGAGIKMSADNGASSLHEIGTLEWVWTTVTDTAEVSDLVGYAYEGGAKTEVFRADTSANQFNLPTGWQFAVNGTPLSSGGISASATPSDGQIGVWTSSSAMEGDAALTFDTTTDSLVVAASGNLKFGAVTILADSAGTMTLSNIDAIDATTETTLESAIDSLSNLTTTGALTSGSIGSGFGTINIGTSNAVSCGSIELGHASDTTLARASAGNVSVEGTLLKKVGTETIWVPASAMVADTAAPAASGSAQGSNGVMRETFDFDAASDEKTQFTVAFPKSWNLGTVGVQFFWTANATTGDIIWAAEAVAVSDDDALDATFGTAATTTDTMKGTAYDLAVSSAATVTIGGTPAAADLVAFRVYRDANAGGDTLSVDGLLLGVKITYTTDAANDD